MNKALLKTLFLAAVAACFVHSTGVAQTTWINSGTGSWNNAGDWSNGVPDGITAAIFSNGGTVVLGSGVSGTTTFLNLGFATGSSGNVRVEGGTLSSFVANIASGSGSLASAFVSSGTWFNSDLVVGHSGTATFDMSGGFVTSGQFARVGWLSGASGVINVTGGTLQQAHLSVGEIGAGTLNVAGGFVATGSAGNLGIGLGGNGTIAVSSGTFVASILNVGVSGTGSLVVSGGRVQLRDNAVVGVNASGAGSIVVSGSAGNRGALETGKISKGSGAGTLHVNGGVLRAARNEGNFLAGFGPNDVTFGPGGAFVDSGTFAIGISSPMSGTGGLTKLGSGTLTLSGNSNYAGETTVSAGTLLIMGDNAAAGRVVVEAGGVLSGTGVVSGALIKDGGKLAIGDATGILNVDGDLTLQNGATLTLKFNGTGAGQFDQIAIEDNFTAGGLLFLDVGYAASLGDAFTIFTNGVGRGWTSGDFIIDSDLGGGLAWDASELSTTGVISVVPEPASTGLALAGFCAVFFALGRARTAAIRRAVLR